MLRYTMRSLMNCVLNKMIPDRIETPWRRGWRLDTGLGGLGAFVEEGKERERVWERERERERERR